MRKEKTALSLEVGQGAAQQLQSLFGATDRGAEFVCEAFGRLYALAIEELRGRFTVPELRLLLATFNKLKPVPRYAGLHILAELTEISKLGTMRNRPAVDLKMLVVKILLLPSFQQAALEIWTVTYSRSDEHGRGPWNDDALHRAHLALLIPATRRFRHRRLGAKASRKPSPKVRAR